MGAARQAPHPQETGKPGALEIAACRPWLDAEIAAIAPRAIVCLGATAAQALIGRDFRLMQQRRFLTSPLAEFVPATVHPSALLRTPVAADRQRDYARFVQDLRAVADAIR